MVVSVVAGLQLFPVVFSCVSCVPVLPSQSVCLHVCVCLGVDMVFPLMALLAAGPAQLAHLVAIGSSPWPVC